jgi:AcrR family transcriptional regulator
MYRYGLAVPLVMPKLWNDTVAAHRRAVREATLDATAALVAAHGLMAVTMSRIAQETGIGRATLYKYFPDVESILMAWHERQITDHLQHLHYVRERSGERERLPAVLEAYALMIRQRPDTELAALLHGGPHLVQAEQHLIGFLAGLLTEGVRRGEVRQDVAPTELARYCLHALAAAGSLPSHAAVRRLVQVTLAGVRPVTPANRQPVDI